MDINENVAQFIITNSTAFNNLPARYSNKLYFLEDTSEIYRGNQLYTSSVIFYSGELPEEKAVQKIYINKDTFEGYCWDGSNWRKIISKYTIVNDITPSTPNDNIPSVEATRKLINSSISNLKFDKDHSTITYAYGSETFELPILNISTKGIFDPITNCIVFSNVLGETLFSIQMEKDNYPIDGYYDEDLQAIILTMRDTDEDGNHKEVVIPAADLVHIRLANIEGNLLKKYSDGYGVVVDISNKIDKVESGKDGRIMTAKTDGNANAINMYVGGSALTLIDIGDGRKQASSNLLATEQAVYDFVKSLSENIDQLASYTMVQSVDTENPSNTSFPSEVAIANILVSLNEQINKINSTLKTIDTSSNNINNQISQINASIVTLQHDVENLQSYANSVSDLMDRIQIAEDNISEISNQVQSNSGDITEHAQAIQNINTSITSILENLNSISEQHSSDKETTDKKISDMQNLITALNTQVQSIIETSNSTNELFSVRLSQLENSVSEINNSSKIEYYM